MKDVLTSVVSFQLRYKFYVLAKGNGLSDVDGNKLIQVWSIAHHFYLFSSRRVVKSKLVGTILGVRYKSRIS